MDFAAYNWVDWAVIILITLSTIVGLIRGFIREGMSLILWILAAWLAFTFANDIAEKWIGAHVNNAAVKYALAFASIFLTTLIIGGFINVLISTAVHKTGLGGTDRLMGLIFGLVRGLFIIAILLLFIKLTPAVNETWYQEAKTPPHFKWLVDWIDGLIPASIKAHLKPQISSDIKSSIGHANEKPLDGNTMAADDDDATVVEPSPSDNPLDQSTAALTN